jgi:cytidylate kinase
VSGDGGVGDCQESPWLCRQLAHMQRLTAMQNDVFNELKHKVEVQNLEISQLRAENLRQDRQIDQLNKEIAQVNAMNHQQNLDITH